MHRIDTPNNVDGLFANPDPTATPPQLPVLVDADWLNDLQENIMAVLAAAGIAPVKGSYPQLLDAIQDIASGAAGGDVTSFNARTGAVELTLADIEAAGGAPLDSPTFTDIPAAPTAEPGTSTTQIATTAFVEAAIAAALSGGLAGLPQSGDFWWTFCANPAPGTVFAQGQIVPRVGEYAGLFAAYGTMFGAGDGSTTFGLPDGRDKFIRGYFPGGGVDPSRTLGSAQTDAIQGHLHGAPTGSNWFMVDQGGGGGSPGANGTAGGGHWDWSTITGSPVSDGANGDPRTATETRPVNLAANLVLKL